MQRRQLVGILKLLFIAGGILLLLPMIRSMGVFKSASPEQKGIIVDVSQIQAGHYQVIEYAGREIWVYHWSRADQQQQSTQERQQAWSVFVPYEPHRGCRVHLQEDMSKSMRFVEPCFNAGFDVKGRRLPDTGIAAQRDLPAIPFHWQDSHTIRLQFGIKSAA